MLRLFLLSEVHHTKRLEISLLLSTGVQPFLARVRDSEVYVCHVCVSEPGVDCSAAEPLPHLKGQLLLTSYQLLPCGNMGLMLSD